MYNIITTIISLIFPMFILRNSVKNAFKQKLTLKEFIKQNKYEIIAYILFVIGFLVRLILLVEYPAGLNQDEASAGYDAWSVLNSGMDRNGKTIPVYFIAWGSGQSVLYPYLMLPFICLFGLNTLTVRLPMAVVGCITLVFVYKLFKQYNKKIGIIGLAFFAICPWHIMKCRWGLDCNLFPDMVIIAMYIITSALRNNKTKRFYLGIAFLSFSVYSYATSYLVLPIFIGLMLIYLLKTKKIKLYNAIIALLIAFIVALPMILYVIINVFDFNEIKLGFITIPRMYVNRYESDISIFSGNILNNALENFINNMKILLTQTDGTTYNCLPFYGITYVFSLPFTIIGLYNCISKRNTEKNMLNILSIVCLFLMIVYNDTNINRLNIVMVPLIMYTIIGLYDTTKNNKEVILPIFILYSLAFCFFMNAYIKYQGKEYSPFTQGIEEPIKYVTSLDTKKVYISQSFTQPYIYTLFYTQTPTEEFIETVDYYEKNVAFESIKSFGKYYFYIPSNMQEKDAVYLVPNDYEYNKQEFNAIKFEKYMVLEHK